MITVMDIANGLVSEFRQFNTQIMFAPDFDLRKGEIEKVIILPIGKEMEIATRSSNQNAFIIDIAYIKKTKASTDVSTLVNTVEGIGNGILRKKINDAICTKLTWNPLFGVEELKANGVFISVIEAKFEVAI